LTALAILRLTGFLPVDLDATGLRLSGATLRQRAEWRTGMVRAADPTRVEIAIGATSALWEAPEWTLIGEVVLPYEDSQHVREEIDALVAEVASDGTHHPHSVSTTGGRASWGGDSGEHLAIVVFLAKSMTDGLIAAAALRLFGKLVQRRHPDGDEDWRAPLARNEAIEYARWVIATRYRELAESSNATVTDDPDALVVTAESQDAESGEWTIGLRDPDGVVYTVTFTRLAGIPTPALVQRKASETR
jgi:hypothetical protein